MRSLFLAAPLVLGAHAASAAVIWGENFDSYADGTGITGVSGVTDQTAAIGDGSVVEIGDALAGGDSFTVVGGALLGTDLDTLGAYYQSPVISVAGLTGLMLELTLTQVGNNEYDASDFVDIAYSADGGSFVVFDDIFSTGTAAGHSFTGAPAGDLDWSGVPLSFLIADASTVQIRVTIRHSTFSEQTTLDDITLSADAVSAVPVPAAAPLLLAGLAGLAALRRRG